MFELDKDEENSLFLQHVICDNETRSNLNDEIIHNGLEKCYFQKIDGYKNCYYHPLAPKVLVYN